MNIFKRKPIVYMDHELKHFMHRNEESHDEQEFSIAKCLGNNFNVNVQGRSARGWMTRCFPFRDFNPSLAQGFCKLEMRNDILVVIVVDIYGFYTQEEKSEFEENGYVLLGYE